MNQAGVTETVISGLLQPPRDPVELVCQFKLELVKLSNFQ